MILDCSSLTLSFTGARFGPRAIRAASARHAVTRSFNPSYEIDPYRNWAKVIDCG